jgi:hypothetical protein
LQLGAGATLYQCVQGLRRVFATLKQHWDTSVFRSAKDGVQLRLVEQAMTDPLFELQFHFVFWLTEWLTRISSWISGCDCHTPEDGAAAVACIFKGRRLKTALVHLQTQARSWPRYS